MPLLRSRQLRTGRNMLLGPTRVQLTAITTVKRLGPLFQKQREEIGVLDNWYRGIHDSATLPRGATAEYRELLERAPSPWARLMIASTSQAMSVNGFRPDKGRENVPAWDTLWQPNGGDAKQTAVHDAALSHGMSYVKLGMGKYALTGKTIPTMRGFDAMHMAAFYDADDQDEFATWALEGELVRIANDKDVWMVKLHDERATYRLQASEDWKDVDFIDEEAHDYGVPPVIRFANKLDLSGRTTGEIEPFVPLLKRIDQDTFDRLIVQRYGAWRVRWIAGMAAPTTDAEKRAAALALRVEDLLISENKDTKFGTLDPTDLSGYIAARDADIRDLAATSQTPPHHLLGQMANLSAEALAAAEASLMRKVAERKQSFGESWESVFRLSAWMTKDRSGAEDFSSRVVWRDTESRSLSQTADALGKLADQLHIPAEMLWGQLPFWTDQDTEDALEMMKNKNNLEQLLAEIAKAMEPDPVGAGAPAKAPTTTKPVVD